jgi:hypothetical protein
MAVLDPLNGARGNQNLFFDSEWIHHAALWKQPLGDSGNNQRNLNEFASDFRRGSPRLLELVQVFVPVVVLEHPAEKRPVFFECLLVA